MANHRIVNKTMCSNIWYRASINKIKQPPISNDQNEYALTVLVIRKLVIGIYLELGI